MGGTPLDSASMLRLSQLNPYSQRFAQALFRHFPEWQPLAKATPEGQSHECSLAVRVTSAVGDLLWVSTDREEVTVGFDAFHTHFESSLDEEEAEAFEEALSFIADLLAERTIVVVGFSEGRIHGATALAPDRLASEEPPYYVKSWLGKYDRTVK